MMRFIDFDGTLVDLWPRYYHVFCSLLNIEWVKIDEYKRAKQKLGKDELVAQYFGKQLGKTYFEEKSIALEEKEFLKYDHLFWKKSEFKEVFEVPQTYILTKRKNPENFIWELEMLGVDARAEIVKGSESKLQWLQEKNYTSHITVAGDSIMDLETGQMQNAEIVMVGYGLGTREQFYCLQIPYLYIDNPYKLLKYLTWENQNC